MKRALDREALARAAHAAGLRSALGPLQSPGEAAAPAGRLGYPVIVKSVSTIQEHGDAVTAGPSTRRFTDERELLGNLDRFPGCFLVQRPEAGTLLSFGGVFTEGRIFGSALSRYLRTWPPDAGNASCSMTVRPEPDLEQAVSRLLQDLGWEGIFELELIRTAAGELVPIDFNPRPYGSMALAIAAGANLPGLWCDQVLGRSPRPARAAEGWQYRWEDAELRNLIWQLRHRHFAAAGQILRPVRRVVHPHFRAADPGPMLARILAMARDRARGG